MKLVVCILAFVLLSFAGLVRETHACSCGPRPTVLDSLERSENVFTARLVSVEKIREKSQKYDIRYIRSSSMVVLKVYKGNLKPGQEVKFAQGGGADCVWTFDENWVGNEYLFYVGKPSNQHRTYDEGETPSTESMFYPSGCGRSGGLKGADNDLLFLNNMSKLLGKTRVSGSYDSWYTDEAIGANKKIKIVGKNKTVTIKADENGFFEIYDLPAGDYRVFPEMPVGWKINNSMMEYSSTGLDPYENGSSDKAGGIPIKIKDKGHVSLDLYFDIDTSISGRVLSPSGHPMKGVCVTAASSELKDGELRGRHDCTDDSGRFEIKEMSKGNYLLVVNDDGKQNANNPFGVVFYPGVTDRKNAGVVFVEPGKYVSNRDIQIPALAELVELRGKLTYSDGTPVVKRSIELLPSDSVKFDRSIVETDSKGEFVLRVPKGNSGTLFSKFYLFEGAYVNCPKIDELLKASGVRGLEVKTNVLSFDGETSNQTIELTLPFPKCEKAND